MMPQGDRPEMKALVRHWIQDGSLTLSIVMQSSFLRQLFALFGGGPRGVSSTCAPHGPRGVSEQDWIERFRCLCCGGVEPGLDTLFFLADADGSGQLSEDEVKTFIGDFCRVYYRLHINSLQLLLNSGHKLHPAGLQGQLRARLDTSRQRMGNITAIVNGQVSELFSKQTLNPQGRITLEAWQQANMKQGTGTEANVKLPTYFRKLLVALHGVAMPDLAHPFEEQVKQDAQAVSRNCARAQDAAATKGAPLRELSVTKPAIPPPQPSMGASQLWGPPLRPSVNPSMPRSADTHMYTERYYAKLDAQLQNVNSHV